MKPPIPVTTASLLDRGFGIFFSSYGGFLLLTGLFALPSFVLNVLSVVAVDPGNAALAGLASRLAEVFLTPIATGAMVVGVFQRLRAERLELKRCLDVAMENFVGILGVVVAIRLAVMAGTLALVIPGILVAIGLFVAIPAFVAEDLGIVDSCMRSWKLTRDHQWPIFVLLALGVTSFCALLVLVFVVREKVLVGQEAEIVAAVCLYAISVVFHALAAVFLSVAYHDMRLANDEIEEQDLAEVFA